MWFVGYNTSVAGSSVSRMKEVIGDLLSLTTAGDDAWTTYGRLMSVAMHAALTGDGLDAVPFLLNSPKDTALARILEEAVLAVDEDAHDLTMPEWTKHCAELLASKSLSARFKTALTLGVNDFFHHQKWTPYFPPAGSGPGGVDLPSTEFLRAPTSHTLLQLRWAGEFAFASGGSLAAVGRLFGYTGGLISISQRTAMGQADIMFCDLFARLKLGGATSTPGLERLGHAGT